LVNIEPIMRSTTKKKAKPIASTSRGFALPKKNGNMKTKPLVSLRLELMSSNRPTTTNAEPNATSDCALLITITKFFYPACDSQSNLSGAQISESKASSASRRTLRLS
jgi:hypothetical protein